MEYTAGPRVARVILAGKPALREIDRHSCRAERKASADILLALIAEVGLEPQPTHLANSWKEIRPSQSKEIRSSHIAI